MGSLVMVLVSVCPGLVLGQFLVLPWSVCGQSVICPWLVCGLVCDRARLLKKIWGVTNWENPTLGAFLKIFDHISGFKVSVFSKI